MEKQEKKRFKKEEWTENLLYLFIIICPILDMLSFLFRNQFHTNISPSTLLRPIIPLILFVFVFWKQKQKKKIIGVSLVYGIYALVHLLLFQITKTQSAYGGIVHEAQYLVNYTFMILNLFLYWYLLKDKDTSKLKVSILIANSIYIFSIYLSILTNTSSSTYIEGMGQKGWFESGNSISSILILSLFIILSLVKEKKYRYWVMGIVGLVGIFLTLLIGTRVGLFGFILVLFLYGVIEIMVAIFRKAQLNKNIMIASVIGIIAVVGIVSIVGSSTLQRRKHLREIEGNIKDSQTNTQSHITGDLLKIKQQIDEGTLEQGYMSEVEKKSIQELYNFANQYQIKNNDRRTQQLVYHICLVKNQKDIGLLLFGNGYVSKFYELVLEMEIPAFLFNFGILGFTLYFVPFLAIFIYAMKIGWKNRKKLDSEYMLLWMGCLCSFIFSLLSGYTFFNSSTMMVIITLNILLLHKIQNVKKT